MTWARLGASWKPKMDGLLRSIFEGSAALRGLRFEKPNEDTKNRLKIQQESIKNGSWRHVIFEGSWGRFSHGFWCILGGPGGVLGCLGGVPGEFRGGPGKSWGAFVFLSPLGAVLGPSWGRLGGQHGPNLAPKTEPKSIKNRCKKR